MKPAGKKKPGFFFNESKIVYKNEIRIIQIKGFNNIVVGDKGTSICPEIYKTTFDNTT